MKGERDGRDVTAFDYHYVTGHGKSRKVHNFSALIIQSPLPLKPLFLRPENIFDKVTDFFGYDDIDFESAEFSRQFYVKAPEKRWAYDILHQRMMEYLLENPKFHFQFGSLGCVFIYHAYLEMTSCRDRIEGFGGLFHPAGHILLPLIEVTIDRLYVLERHEQGIQVIICVQPMVHADDHTAQ